MRALDWRTLSTAERRTALERPAQRGAARVAREAAAIVAAVRRGGDAVLLDFTERFDGVRQVLLAFTDVLEVFSTGQAEMVVVICSGRPRPGEWARGLRAAGYRIPPRRHPGKTAGPPPSRPVNGAPRGRPHRRPSPAEVRR